MWSSPISYSQFSFSPAFFQFTHSPSLNSAVYMSMSLQPPLRIEQNQSVLPWKKGHPSRERLPESLRITRCGVLHLLPSLYDTYMPVTPSVSCSWAGIATSGVKKKKSVFPSGSMKGESSPPVVFIGPCIGAGGSHSSEWRTGGKESVSGVILTAFSDKASSRVFSGWLTWVIQPASSMRMKMMWQDFITQCSINCL